MPRSDQPAGLEDRPGKHNRGGLPGVLRGGPGVRVVEFDEAAHLPARCRDHGWMASATELNPSIGVIPGRFRT
jgi:hypothetical protein